EPAASNAAGFSCRAAGRLRVCLVLASRAFRTSVGVILGRVVVRRIGAGGPLLCHAAREHGERGERSEPAPADRLPDLDPDGHELGIEPAGAVGSRKFEPRALDVAAPGHEAGEERDQRDQRNRAPQPPPGGKTAVTIREPDEGGDQEKNRRSGGGRGGDERPGKDPPADAGANLGVQGEVTKPAAHSFNSSTPEPPTPRPIYRRHIPPSSNPIPSATASVV